MKIAASLAGLLLAASIPATANAEIFTYSTNTNAQVFVPNTEFPVVIDGDAGKTTIGFRTKGKKRVVVSFYAECAVDGVRGSYLDVDILVRPAGSSQFVAITPTNSDNAMCSGFEAVPNNSNDGWVSAVVAGVIEVPKGNHKVKVRGILHSGNSVRLDDILVTVMD